MIRQKSASIVFENRHKHRKHGRDHTHPHQKRHTREGDDQTENRRLGGIGRHIDRTAGSGFRVGVRQPGMKRRCGRVDDKAKQHEIITRIFPSPPPRHMGECDGSGLMNMHQDARQDANTAEMMPQDIANGGALGFFCPAEQNKEKWGPGHDFEAKEKGETDHRRIRHPERCPRRSWPQHAPNRFSPSTHRCSCKMRRKRKRSRTDMLNLLILAMSSVYCKNGTFHLCRAAGHGGIVPKIPADVAARMTSPAAGSKRK